MARWLGLTESIILLTLVLDVKQREMMMSNETEVPGPKKNRRKSGVADRRNQQNVRRSDSRVVTVTTERRQRPDRRKKDQ